MLEDHAAFISIPGLAIVKTVDKGPSLRSGGVVTLHKYCAYMVSFMSSMLRMLVCESC